MNSIKYGLIGNNWGLKILKILESMDKRAKLIKIKSPKKYNNLEKYNEKMFSLNFTHNKEPIIQRFIIDYEKKLVSKKKYNIDLKFACNVYKNIKYLIDSKK